ncbi:MAG: tRNA dimethylallyltransferase [Deltaproteobacteria bacterium]|nr:MAG: tRNA dimethylallyltransferase [Deltaproteobacteria bacterium]
MLDREEKPKLVVILGPTAIGKSKLGIEIARRVGGDIVSADSLQVYRYLDIGTAKPTKEERQQIPHHLIDIVNPDEEFNAGLYRRYAREVIKELHRNARRVIVVGGTYLYVRVLLYGIVEGISADSNIREHLRSLKSRYGLSCVYSMLKSVDPESAGRIHPNDYVRIERALEVYYLTGRRMSELQKEHGFRESEYHVLKIGLFENKEVLKDKINKRVEKMLKGGFVEEVRMLREMGFNRELKPMQSIGYKQINRYLDGEITLEEAVELIKRDTRRFAKRQMTWLRRDGDIEWYSLSRDLDRIVDRVYDFFSH